MVFQLVDVGVAGQVALLHQRVHQCFAQTHNVHTVDRRKVGDGARKLGAAGGVDTADVGGVLLADQRLAADRAGCRRRKNMLRLLDAAVQLGDDLAAFVQPILPADADLVLVDIVLIVQRGAGHAGAAQPRRLAGFAVVENARKGQLARAPDCHLDFVHRHGALLRRILVGDVSGAVFCPCREILPVGDLVNFYHSTVNIVGQLGAQFADFADRLQNFRVCFAAFVVHAGHTGCFQCVQRGAVALHQLLRTVLHIKNKHTQPALARQGRIQKAQRTGRQIAGVGGNRLARRLLRRIVGIKRRVGHIDLAAQFQIFVRHIEFFLDVRDLLRVGKHVIALKPGAAGFRHIQLHFAVFAAAHTQRQAQAVHLGFHRKHRIGMHGAYLVRPRSDILQRENILDGQHRYIVLDFSLCRAGCPTAHLLAG